jgi:tetratricopeptide (TPR) repeat protein
MMAESGVPFLAGTDTPNPWAFPGFGLHDELELLVDAGLTPLQALQAATLNPARFFGRTDELGTIEEGKLADLVLLDANPLEDITNTKQIRDVIANGRLYRRTDLDRILSDIAAASSRKSIADIIRRVLEAEGIDAARERHDALREAAPDSVRFREEDLNALGYRYLGEQRVDAAIAIFEMNAGAYSGSPNAHDSLGDGYSAAGKLDDARNAYARAVELADAQADPRAPNFRERLERVIQQLNQTK